MERDSETIIRYTWRPWLPEAPASWLGKVQRKWETVGAWRESTACSSMASGITGEVLYVDCGYNIMGA